MLRYIIRVLLGPWPLVLLGYHLHLSLIRLEYRQYARDLGLEAELALEVHVLRLVTEHLRSRSVDISFLLPVYGFIEFLE